jgi:hypothetical protein
MTSVYSTQGKKYFVTKNVSYEDMTTLAVRMSTSSSHYIAHYTGGFILNAGKNTLYIYRIPSLMHSDGMMYYKEETLGVDIVGPWKKEDVEHVTGFLPDIGLLPL